MANGKSISLKGAAAGAFFNALAGRPAISPDEQALRIATIVSIEMSKAGDSRKAVALIKMVAAEGLEAAAKVCTLSGGAAGGKNAI